MFAAGLLACTAAACSTAPPIKEQTRLEFQIEVSAAVNPDQQGRPAPIMVRVIELKSPATFDSADFFSLQDDGVKVLGADALVTDEFILRPGDKQTIRRKSHPQATTIGVLAGFRDLGKSVWRATYKLPAAPDAAWYRAAIPADKAKLKIYLDQQTISITELD
ncbi:type VI secretion system lipoprotein TssJ [Paraherbaspirillum soli]|uniref:Type VI secretion system lipoprotein TssJ n=1 Tax=Paraherbaspirillum soli TaxID=631222 RepID=A0ABW0M2V6_9BURK